LKDVNIAQDVITNEPPVTLKKILAGISKE
jgi:hypothetical protein